MAQSNLQLISVRIDPETLKTIDKFAIKHHYWKRNAVINNVLTSVFKYFKDADLYDMCRTPFFTNEEITAIYLIQSNTPTPKKQQNGQNTRL